MERLRQTALLILVLSFPVLAYMPRRLVTPAGMAFEKWGDGTFPIVWSLNPAAGGNIAGARTLDAVLQAAFQAWSGVTTAQVSFTEGQITSAAGPSLDGINLISAAPVYVFPTNAASLTVTYSFTETGQDPLGRKILFPGQILEADILFNPAVPFSTDLAPPPDRVDLQTRALHEIGHLLGLDHSGLLSAVMFPGLEPGVARTVSLDDQIGLSVLYPASTFWANRGVIRGLVKTPSGTPVYGAHVVVVDPAGRPVVSTVTGADGLYQIPGLEPGNYQAYAEPLDGPLTGSEVETIGPLYPNQTMNPNVTTRFAETTGSPTSSVTLTKTAGDNQTAVAGQALATQLEVEVRGSNNALLPGFPVTFRATSGGGVVVPVEATTDPQGNARTRAYLGSGQAQQFTATASTATATFNATANAPVISSISFVDPAANTVAKEIVVNEGNSAQARLRVFDSSGRERTDVPLTYSTLDNDIATVDANGNIQGVKSGFTTLTASGGGVISTTTISVVQVGQLASTSETTGIAQDAARRLYLAARQEHTILLVPDFQSASQVYAGISQSPGEDNGLRLQSRFRNPSFLAIHQADGSLYVADSLNHVIRRVQAGPAGQVETFAGAAGFSGTADGIGAARFNNPQGLALDNSGNLWVADSGNHTIRRINLVTRSVTTVAGFAGASGSLDGTGGQARFNSPAGIAVESETLSTELTRFHAGGAPSSVRLLVADTGNGRIRRVSSDGVVSTLSAVAPLVSAASVDDGKDKVAAAGPVPLQFSGPAGVAADPSGNIYVTEPGTGAVKVVLRNGDVASAAQAGTFQGPRELSSTEAARL